VHKPVTDTFLALLLTRARLNHGGAQIFFCGPKGEPLHVARRPIHPAELELLGEALGLLPELERAQPRPLRASDPGGRFTLAALDEEHDMFVMIFEKPAEAEAREARALAIRKEIEPHTARLRKIFRGALP
jgi:hypothetical protein